MRSVLIGLMLATVAAAPPVSSQYQHRNSGAANAEHHSGPRHSGHLPASNMPRSQVIEPSHGAPQINVPQSTGGAKARTTRPPEIRRMPPSTGSINVTPEQRHPRTGRPAEIRRVPPSSINVTPQERLRTHSVDHRPKGVNVETQHPSHAYPGRPVVSTVPRPGTEPPLRHVDRSSHRSRWTPTWRNDHRYDWRNWRHEHRYRYHFQPYIDPFGWGYYRYTIGWRLWPRYYASNYWIADPAYYRLPPAPAGTHWVRYYNDALLIDTWTGEVLDVIYDFFW